jgi:hypothetical protein
MFYQELQRFIDQANLGVSQKRDYIKDYKGLKVKVGFGIGRFPKVPWISFLAEGQSTSKGIYPVYLYYKKEKILILAYGVSETEKPEKEWNLPAFTSTVKEYFRNNGLGLPYRYGDSYVFKAYNLKTSHIDDKFDQDLDQFLDNYSITLSTHETTQMGIRKLKEPSFQKIFFGAPGSGKSHIVNELAKELKPLVYRTTFHPDSDYASFVGSYKPKKIDNRLTYEFVPQVFTNAYIAAWKDHSKQVWLVIEEINRGNCAQIFGDLFQLLDRDENGKSEYSIKADTDLKDFLESDKGLGNGNDGIRDGELCLPNNFHIIATMNTSDQSLFPMDSAFKRRWNWEYVPIRTDDSVSSKHFEIDIDGAIFNWHDFLRAVNKKIAKVSESEDKQMGSFFIKNSINKEEFKSKVMFYLWSEVCKDEYKHNSFFKYTDNGELIEFSFNDLYPDGGDILKKFIPQLIESEKEK